MHGVWRRLVSTAALLVLLCPAFLTPISARADDAGVVINEIMYHPPSEKFNLQYIELFNRGTADVDLSKWAFSKGVQFRFPDGTRLAAGNYLVICRDLNAFKAQYGAQVPALGNFTGKLSHKAERLELVNAQGQRIDTVRYSEAVGWPTGANGYSSSLERINPFADSESPANWSASNWPARKKPAGTPGTKNDSYKPDLPPLISGVENTPKVPAPEQEVKVRAKVSSPAGVKAVELLYRVASTGQESEEKSVAMTRVSGDEKAGEYEAMIQGQPVWQLVRYRVKATGPTGTERLMPAPNDALPSYTFIALTNAPKLTVPTAYVINVSRPEQGPPHNTITPKRPRATLRPNGAFIYFPVGGKAPEVFDYVRVMTRSGGYKVHFQKDQLFQNMEGINLIVEGPLRWILAEPLAYELYRMAGVPAPATDHVRLSMDGHPMGVHLLIEQPGKTFLSRNGRDDTGNLYKLYWFGQTVSEQHQKRTNLHAGHADLVELLEGLRRKSGAEQWEYIEKNFNVDEFVNYYAVNMCIQNWDGFFNNHYLYHDTGKTGKWEIYPWDEDKTWGDYDGASSEFDWYEMPLNYGATGAKSPRDYDRWGQGMFGGVSWWRPPGHFSGPLLANPEFRKRFLARVQEISTQYFTTEKFFPIIDSLEKRLEPEIQFRAKTLSENPKELQQEFVDDMESFREQVQNRRKFILKELARSQ